MRRIDTTNMAKGFDKAGNEIAFSKARKNSCEEWEVKVYVNGYYDENKTIYEGDREAAEMTKAAELSRLSRV